MGYFTNSDKTLLLVKPELEEEAPHLFKGTGVRIMTGSVKYLGSYIGEPDAVASQVQQRVVDWCKDLRQLVKFANT